MNGDRKTKLTTIETLEPRALFSALAQPEAAVRAAPAEAFEPAARSDGAPQRYDAPQAASFAVPPIHSELPPGWVPPTPQDLPAASVAPQHDFSFHDVYSARGWESFPVQVISFFGIAVSAPQPPAWGGSGPVVFPGAFPSPAVPQEVLEHLRAAVEASRGQAQAGADLQPSRSAEATVPWVVNVAREGVVEVDVPVMADASRTIIAPSPITPISAANIAPMNETPALSLLDRAARELASIARSAAVEFSTAPQTPLVLIAEAIPAAAAVVPAAAQAFAPGMFYFPRLGSATSFLFDSIATLGDEFAAIDADPAATWPSRAAVITAVVIAADVVLLTVLFRRRTSTRRSPFAGVA